MSQTPVNSTESASEQNRPRDPDLANAEIAMRRAAQRARERAERVGTKVVVWENGQVVQGAVIQAP